MHSYSWIRRRWKASAVSGLLVVIIMTIIFVYQYETMYKAADEMISSSTQEMLEQMGNNIDNKLLYIENALTSLCKNKSIQSFFADGAEQGNLKSCLSDFLTTDRSISSVYLYNKNNGILASDFYYGDITDFEDTKWLDNISDLQDKSSIWTLRQNVFIQRNDAGVNVVSLIHTYPLITDNPKGYVLINFEADFLDDIIKSNRVQKNDCVYMVINNSDVLFKNSTYYSVPNEILLDIDFSANERQIIEYGGKTFYVVHTNLQKSTWQLLLANVVSSKFESVNTIKQVSSMIAIVAILLTLFIIILTLQYTGSPAEKFVKRINRETNFKEKTHDADELLETFIYMSKQQRELEKQIKEQIPNLKYRFINSIANGECTSYEMCKEKFSVLNNHLFAKNYIVAITDIDDKDLSSDNGELVIPILCGMYESHENEQIRCISSYYRSHMCVTLFSFATSNENPEEMVEQILFLTAEYVKKYMGITVTSTIGRLCESFSDIQNSYSDAIAILGYHYIFGNDNIIKRSDLPAELGSVVEIDKAGKKLKDLLLGLDKELIMQCCDEFFEIVRKNMISIDKLISICMVYLSEFYEVYKNSVQDSSFDFSSDGIYYSLKLIDNIDGISNFVKQILSEIIDDMKANSKSHDMNICDKVCSNVKKNYTDPDFSLSAIADELNLSVSHLSRLLKKNLGKSFSEYLTEIRIEKAKALLTETNLSIAEIAEKTGYYHSTSFIRMFKKQTMISPSNYRSKYSK